MSDKSSSCDETYIERKYRQDGSLVGEYYFNKEGLRHRLDGPAERWYRGDGSLYQEGYFVENKKHREDGPAHIEYYLTNKHSRHEMWYRNNVWHRIAGPAKIWYDSDGGLEYIVFALKGDPTPFWDFYDQSSEVHQKVLLKDWLHHVVT
jgi:hypothetical protein